MMNIDEYCRRILLSESLYQKLVYEQVDLKPYSKLSKRPQEPGRPPELSFDLSGSMKLPSINQLEDEKNRGLLLHFFLNHELLALEIMALVILKFPELPDSFKRSLLKTMQDEQKHARLYIECMKGFGVSPGEMPVNRFFWNCFKDIEDPLDFITGMSLTFEQANLDFSLYYKDIFENMGDEKTAAVLNEVYVDEISHVSIGLKWFRKWKSRGLSDWQFYVDSLALPLSPARAKGKIFDREGRLKAGLDNDFIDHLQVTSFSKGRAPDIYIFHAFAEASIVQGKSFNTPEWGKYLEKDLSILPLPFSHEDDILLMKSKPSVEHLAKLQRCGFEIPQIIEEDRIKASPLKGRHPRDLKPWGCSPEMDRFLKPLAEQCKEKPLLWDLNFKNLFAKTMPVKLLKMISHSHPWFAEHCDFSVICKSVDDIEKAFEEYMAKGASVMAVKSPFGASGRDILRFPKGKMTDDQRRRLQNLLKKQNELIVEPWVERVADFSAHFHVGESVKYLGITRLVNDHRGQYSASVFGKPFYGLDREVMELFQKGDEKGIHSFYKNLIPHLQSIVDDSGYTGPIGVDFFVYRNFCGELSLRPIVEFNFRYTMGRLALQLEKNLALGTCGVFKIFSILSKSKRASALKIAKYKNEELTMNSVNQWNGGVCQLNEWHDDLKFPVFISVADNPQACFSQLTEAGVNG